ncbi:MAG TPA: hypothetical protein VK722_15280 [Candidatus Aquilonibacter sp.]|nr:hypothetical protein [Candidatus Aquilonibacter sp.]
MKTGSTLQKRSNGKVSDIHDAERSMDIHHSITGRTRVTVERPDHSRIVAQRGAPGYVQRGYMHNGHAYVQRIYSYNGRSYTRFYSVYQYRGIYLNVYAPAFYYAPGFYGWADNPWYALVNYSWGWAGSPWFGYYSYYFVPSPFYSSASFWLSDYLISSDLSTDYQEQQASPDASADVRTTYVSPALTPAVKEMIASEVRSQLVLENQEAARNQDPDPESSGIGRPLSDSKTHVFVVGSSLDVIDSSGAECELGAGDVLNMVSPAAPDATSVNLVVLSSKASHECAKSATVAITLSDLQEMHNQMRETIDQGLQELQTKQGQDGLPAAPPSIKAAQTNSAFTRDAPSPDPNVAAEVNRQLTDASQVEKEVLAQAQQEPRPTPAPLTPIGPVTIQLGQTVDEVTASLGSPLTVIDLNSKKIFKYKDMKITFKDGKVADVE